MRNLANGKGKHIKSSNAGNANAIKENSSLRNDIFKQSSSVSRNEKHQEFNNINKLNDRDESVEQQQFHDEGFQDKG